MDSYREGLNFVPLLTQRTTPPCSSRSRISLNKPRTQRSIIYYNGNYEGDTSMFKDKQYEWENLNLVDTESDSEFPKDTTARSTYATKDNNKKTSIAWRLLQFLLENFLKPETSEKVRDKIENFMESPLYNQLIKWSKLLNLVFGYIFYITLILWKHLYTFNNFFWKRRALFRNLSKRLLWWLTLAKCSDLSLFLLILITIPILVILSICGLIIELFGAFRNIFHYWSYFMNKI